MKSTCRLAALSMSSYGRGRGGRRGIGGWRGYQGGWGGGRGRSGERSFKAEPGFEGVDEKDSRYGGGGKRRPPPGLRGKEIGLWYASQQGTKNKEVERQRRQVVHIDRNEQHNLRGLIHSVQSSSRMEIDDEAAAAANIPSSSMPSTSAAEFENVDEEEIPASEIIAEALDDWDNASFADDKELSYMAAAMERLNRKDAVDELFKNKSLEKQKMPEYCQMLEFRQQLPAYKMREEIVEVIKNSQVCVISGETGCGKTTQVPQLVLDDALLSSNGSVTRIVVTQPRRISAITVAERVAKECGEPLGDTVGYQIRLESTKPRDNGSLLYCTTGVLLQWLQSDPDLLSCSHIFVDEVHERDVNVDFLLIILKQIVERRSNLKVILMSATLNSHKFAEYFGGQCPLLEIPGRCYPVEAIYLPEVIELTGFNLSSQELYDLQKKNKSRALEKLKFQNPADGASVKARDARFQLDKEVSQWLSKNKHRYSSSTMDVLEAIGTEGSPMELVAATVLHIARKEPPGAILVFVTGMGEIKTVIELVKKWGSSLALDTYPLHSLIPTANQRQIFNRPPPGRRKVIVATNIAETSITIDDVVYVVDSGRINITDFDSSRNTNSLTPVLVSKANARQREGRAGRVQAGVCYHLFSSLHERRQQEFLAPEILRKRLEDLILQVKLLGFGDVRSFLHQAIDAPNEAAVDQSLKFLVEIGALTRSEELTPLGRHLARLPVAPQCGKMILMAALFSCLDPILTVAASLDFKDAFYSSMEDQNLADKRRLELSRDSQSDHILLVHALDGWKSAKRRGEGYQFAKRYFLAESILRNLEDMRHQFGRMLCELQYTSSPDPKHDAANRNSHNTELVRAVICAGLYPNLVQADGKYQKRTETFGRPKLRTRPEDPPVELFGKSVNNNLQLKEQTAYLCYHKKMRLEGKSRASIFDTTVLSCFPILFFGGEISSSMDGGRPVAVVDGWIKFYMDGRLQDLIRDLQTELAAVLDRRAKKPSAVDWSARGDSDCCDTKILAAIVDLLSRKTR